MTFFYNRAGGCCGVNEANKKNDMVIRHTGEEQLCVVRHRFVFDGTNGRATSLGLCGGYEIWDLDSHKALLKAARS